MKALRLWPIVACVFLALCASLRAAPVEEVFSFLQGPTSVRSLVEGADGNLYGVCDGGRRISDTANGGLLFRITPAGVTTVLHEFEGTLGADPIKLIRGLDGVLYGLTSGGGVVSATIFQVGPAGVPETLYTFSGASPAELVATTDGTIHFTTRDPTSGQLNAAISKRTAVGAVTTLASVTGGISFLCGDGAGNLFGVNYLNYTSGYRVLRVAAGGGVTLLETFPSASVGGASQKGSSLAVGTDGNIYGHVEFSAFFRLTQAGVYTALISKKYGGQFHHQDASGVVFSVDGNFPVSSFNSLSGTKDFLRVNP
ncbi:MAG: choice-of-anchor tandem repeat GloVer-containing protein, partial [Chthoniobacteraceae bacterium]